MWIGGSSSSEGVVTRSGASVSSRFCIIHDLISVVAAAAAAAATTTAFWLGQAHLRYSRLMHNDILFRRSRS
jgi:hypothetical protein